MNALLLIVLLLAGTQDDLPEIPNPESLMVELAGQEDEGEAEDATSGYDSPIPYPIPTPPVSQATQPVSIYAYDRHYEPPKSDEEVRYEAGIENGRAHRQNQIHTLEGAWQVYDADNVAQIHFIFRATGPSGNRRIEGAWRLEGPGAGVGRSGFVESVIEAGAELEISFFAGKALAPNILHLRRGGDGLWHGTLMTPDGKTAPITLAPAR